MDLHGPPEVLSNSVWKGEKACAELSRTVRESGFHTLRSSWRLAAGRCCSEAAGCLRRDGAGAGCRVLAPEFCSDIPTEPDGASGACGSQCQEITKREVTPLLCNGNSSVNDLQALLGHRLHGSEAASFLRLPFTREVRVRHSKAKACTHAVHKVSFKCKFSSFQSAVCKKNKRFFIFFFIGSLTILRSKCIRSYERNKKLLKLNKLGKLALTKYVFLKGRRAVTLSLKLQLH